MFVPEGAGFGKEVINSDHCSCKIITWSAVSVAAIGKAAKNAGSAVVPITDGAGVEPWKVLRVDM